jgi:squalene synthase HpnC
VHFIETVTGKMKNNVIENKELESAYLSAVQFTKSHYENFPVISLFLPKRLRKHVAAVYQFARQADDIADEGKENSEFRIRNLELYEQNLTNCLDGRFENNFWMALNHTIQQHQLTPQYFYDLLSAFKQDVVKTRYSSHDDVLDYCRRSANPVGRIILEFFNVRDEESMKYSDAICTALQLTNFYQDVSIDIEKNRIYIAAEDIKSFNVKTEQFFAKSTDSDFTNLIKFEVERTQNLFNEGKKLIERLPKELKIQISMTVLGGEKILEKIGNLSFDVLNSRPKLSKLDYLNILLKAIVYRS